MAKINKIPLIIVGTFLLAVPPLFSITNLALKEKEIPQLVNASSGLEETNIILNPINIDQITADDNGHYLLLAELNDTNNTSFTALLGGYGGEVTSFNYPINEDKSISLDDDLSAVIASMSLLSHQDDELILINEECQRYFGFIESDYSATSVTYIFSSSLYNSSDSPIRLINENNKIYFSNMNFDGSSSYLTLTKDERGYSDFILSEEQTTSFYFYKLPNNFYETYSWKNKLLSIDENDNSSELLAMYQGLTVYDKESVLANFYRGDSSDSSSQTSYDYTGQEADLGLETLYNQFKLYETIVSRDYTNPFRCQDVNENDIIIDKAKGIISGFSTLDRLCFYIDGSSYTNYESFNINTKGEYYFIPSNGFSDFDFAGKTVSFAYGVSYYQTTLSENPVSIVFPERQEIVPISGYSLNYDQVAINISNYQEETASYYFFDSFKLSSLPEGYEATLVTEAFYRYYTDSINDPDRYGDIDTSLVNYQEDTLFDIAFDRDGSSNQLEESTNYYLLFRLPANDDYMPSYICGSQMITTPSIEETYMSKARMENYQTYLLYKKHPRFAQYLEYSTPYSQYQQNLDSIIQTFSTYDELLQYFTDRSIDDLYYIEASKDTLFASYYDLYNPSKRMQDYYSSMESDFNIFIDSLVTLDKALIDEYVDDNMIKFDDQYSLYLEQEYAVEQLTEYFNFLSSTYLIYVDNDEVFAILKENSIYIYTIENKEEIAPALLSAKEALYNWFNERMGQ